MKRKIYYSFFILNISFSLFILSCLKKTKEEYFPIYDGSRWEYSLEYLFSHGVGIVKGKAVSRIDGKEIINNIKYYKIVVVTSGLPGAEQTITYVRNSKDGIYAIDAKKMNEGEYLMLPFSLSIGQSWRVEKSDLKTEYFVEAKETAELINNKYENSFKISSKSEGIEKEVTYDSEQIFYYAPGIGLVKSTGDVTMSNGVKFSFTQVLEKYEK